MLSVTKSHSVCPKLINVEVGPQFSLGSPLEVDEARQVLLWPGTATGPVTGPAFQYSSEAGAAAVRLGPGLWCYYNGGCTFTLPGGESGQHQVR